MPDWQDVLDAISGGAMGVTKGLTAGAEPFNAWENVRTKDLANDRSEINLRDLQLMQNALEAEGLGYYNNAATAKDALNRKSTSTSDLDIFGNENKLSLNKFLASPEFQDSVSSLDPSDPQYRDKLAAAIARYDPTGGVKAYDSFGVEKMQNQNLNQEAALQYIQSWVRRKDPTAIVYRKADGTVAVLGQQGEEQIPGDLLVKVASMISAKTPYDAVSQGLKDEGAIQKLNIDLLKATGEGRITPAQALRMVEQRRIAIAQEYTKAMQELTSFRKSSDYQTLGPEERAVVEQPLLQRMDASRKGLDSIDRTAQTIMATSGVPGTSMPNQPRVAPTGGSTVTAPRPPPGALAARAAGAAGGAPWGASSEGPAYPTPGADPLQDFLSLIGAAP